MWYQRIMVQITKFNARYITKNISEIGKISCILSLSYVSSGAAGFVKSVWNPSFSGGTEALNCAKKNGFGDLTRIFASFFSWKKKVKKMF